MEPDLIKQVTQVIFNELRGTIPSSIDPMRAIRFEQAAIQAIDAVRNYDANKSWIDGDD